MDVDRVLAEFVLKQHAPIQDVLSGRVEQKFILCFDEAGRDVPIDEVAKVSPGGKQGELDYFEPVPGVGHYANLRLAGSGASFNGASTRYVYSGPNWSATVHVTEPSAGGDPDAVVDTFEATPGTIVFATGLAARI